MRGPDTRMRPWPVAHRRCGDVAAKHRSRQHRRCCGLRATEAGVVAKRTMKVFDEMCLTPVEDTVPARVREIRLRENASQVVFPRYLNVTNAFHQLGAGLMSYSGGVIWLVFGSYNPLRYVSGTLCVGACLAKFGSVVRDSSGGWTAADAAHPPKVAQKIIRLMAEDAIIVESSRNRSASRRPRHARSMPGQSRNDDPPSPPPRRCDERARDRRSRKPGGRGPAPNVRRRR